MSRSRADIRMLGGFELRDQRGQLLTLTVRKAEAVLALLALEPGRTQTRSKLCGMLWPNVPEAQARHSLRQALVAIRRVLPDTVATRPRTLELAADDVSVDVADVLGWLAASTREALERVSLAYRGDLLDGIVIDEEPFEQWLTFERERLRAAVCSGLVRLVELHTTAGALPDALQVSKQVLQLDPLREPTLRTGMQLLVQLGRRAEALQLYRSHARTLRQSVGVEPESETLRLAATLEPTPSAEGSMRATAAAAHRAANGAALVRPRALARATGSDTLAPARPSAPLIVRRAEVAQLMAAYGRAGTAGAELCLIEGEAGVGKSHLCLQLAQRMAAHDVRVLRGRCFESEQVLPFSCWSDLLFQARLVDDPETFAALPLELQRELARLLPELPVPVPVRAADDPSAVFQALAALIARWCATGPVCLVLEDLHWADEMSLRFLCHVTRRHDSRHACSIVATVRNDEISAHTYLPCALAELERDGRLRRVPVAPFTFAQTCRLAQQWAKQLSLAVRGSAWLERIWQISEGNALAVVESARALVQPELALDLTRLSVPERLRALIRRRVASLSPSARELATIAAVYGRELHPQLLAAFMDDARLCLALEELVEARLLRAQDERIVFTHDRVRETLYADLLPASRQHWHGRIAAVMTPLAAGAVLGQAGYHHAKAGNADAAIALLRDFSEHAKNTHALGDAVAALETAIEQARSLAAERRAPIVTELAIRQAFCLAFLGRFAAMATLLERCEDLAERVEEPLLASSYHYWRGFALTFLGRSADARNHAEHAIELAAATGDRRACGTTHNLAAHQCLLAADFAQGAEHAARALELLRGCDETESLIFACMNVCLNRAALGQIDAALAAAAQAEREAERGASGRSRAMAALTTGVLHAYLERWDVVLTAAQQALAVSKTPFTLAPACALLALTQIANGEAGVAVTLLEHVISQFDAESPLTHHVIFMVLFAEALLRSGATRRAKQVASEAAQAACTCDHIALGLALRTQGLAEHALGELAPARAHIESALAFYRERNLPIAITLAQRALAEIEPADQVHHPR